MDLLDPVKDFFGGGTLTPILIGGGLLALYLAYKVVTFTVKLVALAGAAILFAGTVPWASADLDTDAAHCAQRAVQDALDGWEAIATKRVTVEEVTGDATCAPGGDALEAGAATVKLRTFYDLPIRTWRVDPGGTGPV